MLRETVTKAIDHMPGCTEGVEIEVLASGINLLKRGKTKVIVEMSDAKTLERGRTLLPNRRFDLIGANHWLVS